MGLHVLISQRNQGIQCNVPIMIHFVRYTGQNPACLSIRVSLVLTFPPDSSPHYIIPSTTLACRSIFFNRSSAFYYQATLNKSYNPLVSRIYDLLTFARFTCLSCHALPVTSTQTAFKPPVQSHVRRYPSCCRAICIRARCRPNFGFMHRCY